MLKKKTNIFVTILFTFVAFMLIGTPNVNAVTSATIVTTEQQLRDALDGVKEVDGSTVTDTETTEVQLDADIELENDLAIYVVNDLTLDLNGHCISGKTNSKTLYIDYGSNSYETFTSGSLTIKDSSTSKAGTIKSYNPIGIYDNNTSVDTPNYKLTIDGGKFYNLYWGSLFEFKSSNFSFDFTVNDGYFEYAGSNCIFLHANSMVTNNITLDVKLNKFTMKGTNTRLVYSSEKDFKISDVVSESSKINLKHSINPEEAEITDRTVSVTQLNALQNAFATALGESSLTYYFDTIEITRKEGFDVSNVTLTEIYSYTAETATPVDIPIYNRGTSALKIKNVTVSDNTNFKIVDGNETNLSAGATDTTWEVQANSSLATGTYTTTITVTDENDKTYTSTVTLNVGAKPLSEIGIYVPNEIIYGNTYTPTPSGITELNPGDYVIKFAKKNGATYSDIDYKPTAVGEYRATLMVTNKNYSASDVSCDFKIIAKTIAPSIDTIADQIYTGEQITPNISVSCEGVTLTKDTDYTVEYDTNTNVGEGKVTIKAVSGSNYTFADTIQTFNIVAKTLTANDVTLTQTSYRHTGSAITPEPVVKVGEKILVKDTDYELSYSNNTNIGAGTATVTVTGKGNYTGTIGKNFSIVDKDPQVISFDETTVTKTYGDDNFTITAKHTTGNGTVTYTSTNTNVATVNGETGEVTIKKAGTTKIITTAGSTTDYAEATAEYTLTVNKKELSFTPTIENKVFDNNKTATANVVFTGLVGSETLTKDTDYTATAEFASANVGNNIDVNVTVTLKDTNVAENYTLPSDSITVKANITGKAIVEGNVTVDTDTTYTYNGSAIEPNVVVKDGTTTLTKGTHYTVEYQNNINAGTGIVKVTGIGNYSEIIEKEFTINKKSITPIIEDITAVTYNGIAHEPELTVKDGTTPLIEGIDYTVEYTDNVNAGNADAEITAVPTSNYTFTTTGKSFTINKYEIQESDVTLEYISTSHTGSAKEPTVEVKMRGTTAIDPLKYTVTYNNNTDVGTADVTVAIKEGDTNFEGSVTKHFDIVDKETVTFTGIEDNQTFTYDGTAKTPVGTITVEENKVPVSELEVIYKGTESTTYSSEIAPTEVGTYSVTYKVLDTNENYMGSITYNFTIKKVKLSVTFEKTTYTYTGENILIELPESFDADLMFIATATGVGGEVAPILKEVDTYNYRIGLKYRNHYEWAGTTEDYLPLTLYVEKATPTITISNLSQKVGSVVAPTYEITPAPKHGLQKIEYKLSTADDSAYTETLPTEAGTYNVRVSIVSDENLNDKTEVATLTITKKSSGGGGGGSSTTTYTITVKENENAEITPNGTVKVKKGDDKTFSIKAKDGYEIEDVLVDGKSVGVVSKYTFENVKAKHTLEVKVKKAEVEEEKPTIPEVKETFTDVKKADWYFEAIEYVAKKGLMNGMGNNEFSPNATTTRGMIVTILYRLEGEPAVEESSFTDVPSDAYYAKAIAWAEKNGIVLGLGEGKFGPAQEITREQLATIMYRYSMYKKYDTSVGEDTNILSYNDIQDLAEYTFTAMQYACGDGLITGMGNGNLAPKGNATRAQLATILMRYCEKYMK